MEQESTVTTRGPTGDERNTNGNQRRDRRHVAVIDTRPVEFMPTGVPCQSPIGPRAQGLAARKSVAVTAAGTWG